MGRIEYEFPAEKEKLAELIRAIPKSFDEISAVLVADLEMHRTGKVISNFKILVKDNTLEGITCNEKPFEESRDEGNCFSKNRKEPIMLPAYSKNILGIGNKAPSRIEIKTIYPGSNLDFKLELISQSFLLGYLGSVEASKHNQHGKTEAFLSLIYKTTYLHPDKPTSSKQLLSINFNNYKDVLSIARKAVDLGILVKSHTEA